MALLPANVQYARDLDGAAILDMRSGVISTLNATGAYVWEELARGRTIEAIVSDLSRETGEPAEDVHRDLLAFVEELKEKSLFD